MTRWNVPFLLGFALLPATTIAFAALPPDSASTPDVGVVFALEFARTPADVAAALGADEPGYVERVARLRWALGIDMGYAALYAAFMASWALAVSDWRRGRDRLVMLVIALAAGAYDMSENLLLLRVLDGQEASLPYVRWAARAKFAAIAFAIGYASSGFGCSPKRWRSVMQLLTLIPATLILTSIFGGINSLSVSILTFATAAGWSAMWAYAGVQVWRARSSRVA